nr:hypothetical protein [Acidobacteriota bacterium]
MPTETGTGTAFLVDPMGAAPVALDEEDFKNIRQYLHVKHSANDETAAAIDWLLHLSIEYDGNKHKGLNDHEILKWMVTQYLSDWERDEAHGVLAGSMKDSQPRDLSERELEILECTLATIRVGGWFPEWLRLQVSAIAGGEGIPGDRHPTPLQIAASLGLCIQEHQEEMETARQFAKRRPDLVIGATI